MSVCLACGDRPTVDAFVCTDCLDQLHGDLVAIPGEEVDLIVELTNQSRKGGSQGMARSAETRLPFSPMASALLGELRSELVGACRMVALDDPTRLPADTITAMAGWLDHHIQSVGQREGGGEFCNALGRLRRRIRVVVDSPPERVYIGDCPVCMDNDVCSPMYAPRGEITFSCRQCRTDHNIADAMASLEEYLRDYRLTAAEVELVTGKRVKADRVQKWAVRGRIDRDSDGKVRFGDVLTLEARVSA